MEAAITIKTTEHARIETIVTTAGIMIVTTNDVQNTGDVKGAITTGVNESVETTGEVSATDLAETTAFPAAEKDEGAAPLAARVRGKAADELPLKRVTARVGATENGHVMVHPADPATAAPVRRGANRDVRTVRSATPSWTRW